MNYEEEIEKRAIKRANGIYSPTQRDLRYINCKIDYSAGANSMLSIIEAKDAEIEHLKQADKWIKVEDRLPNIGVEVNAFHPSWIDDDYNPLGVRTGFLNGDDKFYSAKWNNYHDCYQEESDIMPTYWQPLPAAPKE